MERWQNEKEKEVWRENVIYAVKYGLEHSNVLTIFNFFPLISSSIQKNYKNLMKQSKKMTKKFKYDAIQSQGIMINQQDICQANQKNLTENLKQFTDINQDIIQIYDKIKTFEDSIQVLSLPLTFGILY